MLRMYTCNWCFKKQVRDHGSLELKQQGDRMHLVERGVCTYRCHGERRTNMRPMIKDMNGDWIESEKVVGSERMEVTPPIMWH